MGWQQQLWFLLTLHLCTAHQIDNDDPFPLHTAVQKGDLNLVKHLLQGGANINQQNSGWLYTPLHYAAYYGRDNIVRHLLLEGASKTIKDHEGLTALDLSGWIECNNNAENNQLCKEAPWNYAETKKLLSRAVCRPRCVSGQCVGPNLCKCNQGWIGSVCRTPVCNPRCANGECVSPNECKCNPGWEGSSCQTQSIDRFSPSCTDDSQCPTHQLCDGRDCIDICSTDTCRKNEICSVNILSGFKTSTCRCPDGFFVDRDQICKKSGCTANSNCGNDKLCQSGTCIDPCDLITCGQGARCRVHRRRPQCFCPVLTQGNPLVQCQSTQDSVSVSTHAPSSTKAPIEINTMCTVPSDTDSNITILKCGIGQTSNCVKNNKVPVGTDLMVSCWRNPPFIVHCSDNIHNPWHTCDASHSCQLPLTSLVHLCQQEALNAQYCGYRPPYYHSSPAAIQQSASKEWPWLVGIFRYEKYVCTGTLINVRYVISAAHCTAQSKSSAEPIDILEIKIQHFTGDQLKKTRIDKIIHHPQFRNGNRPEHDISLIRLQEKEKVTFSKTLMPACVAKQLPLQVESAVAFDRNEGENFFKWRTLIRKLDHRCQSSGNGNSCHLEIKDKQFCSAPIFPGLSSVIEQGSSGGPYIVNTGTEENEQQSVVGVASYRVQDCGDPFTVYTDITAYSRWIEYCLDTALDAPEDCHGYTGF